MKTLNLFLALGIVVIMNGCSSTRSTSSSNADDVYYSNRNVRDAMSQSYNSGGSTYISPSSSNDYSVAPRNNTYERNSNANQNSGQNSNSDSRLDYSNSNHNSGSTTSQRDDQGNASVNNNSYYNDDDYYDYAYTSRIRRFYRPVGWSYYDDYYTNSYWYDYNPYSYGVSIYCGYNWWAPSYWYSSPLLSFSYGYNPYGFYYPHYYNPFYASYNGFYGGGFYNGFYNGFYSNPYYFNSYDPTSYVYYGPRTSHGTGTGYRSTSIAGLYHREMNNQPHTSVSNNPTTANIEARPINPVNIGSAHSVRGNENNSNPRSIVSPTYNLNNNGVKNNIKDDVRPDQNNNPKNYTNYEPSPKSGSVNGNVSEHPKSNSAPSSASKKFMRNNNSGGQRWMRGNLSHQQSNEPGTKRLETQPSHDVLQTSPQHRETRDYEPRGNSNNSSSGGGGKSRR